ncbi:MAG: hypothetical protein DWH91_06040 [Planctomycetota bacterium]|nr:MAG: hypothetical protein DWH91_06040 [Planctomycetota bacterium]
MPRSRIEADREDMLAEAVNLRERVEQRVPGWEELVTIGRNVHGHWSFYFGPDQMIRVDAEARVRRALEGGKLYRTQGETLAELTRVRYEAVTELQRRDLSADEVAALLLRFQNRMGQLLESLRQGTGERPRSVGITPEFDFQLVALLASCVAGLQLAPALATKRQ